MRSREDILNDSISEHGHQSVAAGNMNALLEVLLDIRDLLADPPRDIVGVVDDDAAVDTLPPEKDELFDQAVSVVRTLNVTSAGLLAKQLAIPYYRASRLIDQLEAHGIISPRDGAKPRKVL